MAPCSPDAPGTTPGRFRRLRVESAGASHPRLLRLVGASSNPKLEKLPSVRSFAACKLRLLRPRLTSGEPSCASDDAPSWKAARQISRGKARDLRSSPVASTPGCSRWHWASSLAALSPTTGRLVCASCSSGRSYAYRFFPATPRDAPVTVPLAVLDIRARRGLSPPGHFPARFRSPVQNRAMPGTPQKNGQRKRCPW